MHNVQAGQLLYYQEQKEGGKEVGIQEVLQMVQKRHSPQRSASHGLKKTDSYGSIL